jgi:peptidoglycan/xylan/chitin deacetylase (PgdA/CDA1 family)
MSFRKNKILKIAAIIIISLSISLGGFYFFWLSPRYTVSILTYHYFGYESVIEGKHVPLLFITPDNFEKQMRYLKEKDYRVISLDALVEGLKNGRRFPHNTVVITIDDGHKSIFTYAYPSLKKYGFPATVFLISDYIGVKPYFLNWDEAKEMSKNNISFGGHTRNHVYLSSIKNNKDALWYEIAGCKKVIEDHLGIPIYYFCYPGGGFNEEIEMLVKKAGYKGACATNRGYDILDKNDLYELNRISIRNRDISFSLWAKVSGYYNLFRTRKSRD